MPIVKSQEIKGKLTHWVSRSVAEQLLKGEYTELPEKYTQSKYMRSNLKPSGTWLSWNNGWEDWCKTEMPSFIKGKVCLKAKLKKNLNILLIGNLDDFIDWIKKIDMIEMFKDENKKLDKEMNLMGFRVSATKRKYTDYQFFQFFNAHIPEIVWNETYKICDGIALTNKGQWDTRMNTFLYGWDCASICVFDLKNIEFERVEKCKSK